MLRSPTAVLVLALLLSSSFAFADGGAAAKKKILVYTETTEYEHVVVEHIGGQPSLVERVLAGIGQQSGAFDTVNFHDGKTPFTADGLKDFDAVLFFTHGDPPLKPEERTALLDYVKAGHGFIGVHCVSGAKFKGFGPKGRMWQDTFPELTELLGAFTTDCCTWGPGNIIVEDQSSPITRHLGAAFKITDEHLGYQDPYSRDKLHVLLKLDTTTFPNLANDRGRSDKDYAIAWTHDVGKGRVFSTSLGRLPQTWQDIQFQKLLLGAIEYATGNDNPTADLAQPVAEKLVDRVDDWKPDEGFTSLFNGHDLTGWVESKAHEAREVANPKTQFPLDGKTISDDKRILVEDGVIVGNSALSRFSQDGDVFTSQSYGKDFIYRLDTRDPYGGDSGIYVRVGYCGHDGQVNWDGGTNKPWNPVELFVTGDYVEGTIDGKINYQCYDVPLHPSGPVGFQVFMGPFEFRHLCIEEATTAMAYALKKHYGLGSADIADLQTKVEKPGPELVPALIKALNDPTPANATISDKEYGKFIRYEAASYLANVYADNKDAAAAVDGLLKSDVDWSIGVKVLSRVNPTQADIVPTLLKQIAVKDANKRGPAMKLLRLLGPNGKSASPQLQAMLNDKQIDTKRQAFEVLIAVDPDSPQAVAALTDAGHALLAGKDHNSLYPMLNLVKKWGAGAQPLVPDLLPLLKNTDNGIVNNSADILLGIAPNDPQIQSALKDLADSTKDENMKRRITEALAKAASTQPAANY